MADKSIDFFEHQFQRQVEVADYHLNPFEKLALPFLSGRVLDLGCGLGNLTIESARRGCTVLALDTSPTAIEHILSVAVNDSLPIQAKVTDLLTYQIMENFDVINSIGLLMFMTKEEAYRILNDIKSHVVTNGYVILNVLIEGTTFLDMFEPNHYYLFGQHELQEQFKDWEIIEAKYDNFEAPGPSLKMFITLVARKQ